MLWLCSCVLNDEKRAIFFPCSQRIVYFSHNVAVSFVPLDYYQMDYTLPDSKYCYRECWKEDMFNVR